MKRTLPFLSILLLLALAACNLQMPSSRVSTPDISLTETLAALVATPVETAAPTQAVVVAETAAPPSAAPPTPVPPTEAALVTAEPAAELPTATSASATEAPQPAASQAEATQASAAATAVPAKAFDPYAAYGDPKYQNPMQYPNLGEWAQAETKLLPDNRNIRLRFKDGELYVTGKRLGFSTWWFSYHTLNDAYIEMTFETENCSGEDAYGIIFRGPPHLAGISYGYVVSFTCNGSVWVFRLDDASPWEAETLVEEDDVYAIRTGPDEENVIGIRAEGEKFVVFANGVQVAEVEDDHFEKGRVGVFVRAARPNAYTYRVTNFAYWLLGEDE